MKRVLFLLVCLGGVLCTMCDPERRAGVYYVKNNTERTLHLLQSGSGNSIHTPRGVIAPGDSIQFGSAYVRKNKHPYFELWIRDEVARQGKEVSLKVSSQDGVLLKEWRYLDRSQPGKQFFSEPFWRHYDVFRDDWTRTIITDLWIFDIQPEDIALPEP